MIFPLFEIHKYYNLSILLSIGLIELIYLGVLLTKFKPEINLIKTSTKKDYTFFTPLKREVEFTIKKLHLDIYNLL